MRYEIEEGILPKQEPRKAVAYAPEYKRGYLSAHQRVPALTLSERDKQKGVRGRTAFVEGWRDYFREHC